MRDASSGGQLHASRITHYVHRRAFTLIEIMVVVAIMGIILATGIPSIYRMMKREGMRQAVFDVTEVCKNARARAIFSSSIVEVAFHPVERRFEVSGGGGGSPASVDANGDFVAARPAPPPSTGLAGQIPEEITIEMLDINLQEYRESSYARVRFFPNGTCDELTLIMRSDKNEWKKITLEVTTGLVSVTEHLQ